MESKIEMALSVEVILGSPRKNCLQFGICKVEFSLNQKDNCPCFCPALLCREANGAVSLVFHRHRIAPEVWKKHFASGVFRVDDEFVFRKEIIAQIGLDALTVFPGKYPLAEINGRTKLTLTSTFSVEVEKGNPLLTECRYGETIIG